MLTLSFRERYFLYQCLNHTNATSASTKISIGKAFSLLFQRSFKSL